MGLSLEAAALDRTFATAWNNMPARPSTRIPREDDDKGWWRDLVNRVLEQTAPATNDLDRDAFFEAAYSHFAEAGVWQPYPEVIDVLTALQAVYDSPSFRISTAGSA